MIKLNGLDHVAIRVSDMEASALWYENALGLKRFTSPKWGSFPIFLLAGKTGVALFPADISDTALEPDSRNVKIDHFAFNVDRENFERARTHFDAQGIKFIFQDHHFFHSIYAKDPDGHTVELTTLVVDAAQVYGEQSPNKSI